MKTLSDMRIEESKENGSNIFLTGAILLANLDYIGLADYAVKAFIGGIVYMGFKIGSDWIAEKIRNKRKANNTKTPLK